jgi:hypothetical protein
MFDMALFSYEIAQGGIAPFAALLIFAKKIGNLANKDNPPGNKGQQRVWIICAFRLYSKP